MLYHPQDEFDDITRVRIDNLWVVDEIPVWAYVDVVDVKRGGGCEWEREKCKCKGGEDHD
jgi:hypothetical protein